MGRAENDFCLELGRVVNDRRGHKWVFIGWRQNTVGKFPLFVAEQDNFMANYSGWGRTVVYYSAAFTETLLRKFPDLEECLSTEARAALARAEKEIPK